MDKNLKKLLIKTKKAVFSHQIGNNSSKFKGDGYDFVELREYEDGEDIRKIDWVISAKLQKPFVKVFQTQRELNISIVPILSGSVHFGTVKFKHEMMTEICSVLGYSAVANGDSYTSYIYNDDITQDTKSTKTLLGVDKMCENIYNYDVIGKKIDYENISKKLFSSIKKRSIIFLIGDFFNTENLNLKLLSKKHEVVVIMVRDKFEEKPSKLGNVNLTDPSSSITFDGDLNSSLVKEYEKKVKINDHILYENLRKNSIEFIKIYTDENPIIKLMKLFR